MQQITTLRISGASRIASLINTSSERDPKSPEDFLLSMQKKNLPENRQRSERKEYSPQHDFEKKKDKSVSSNPNLN